MSKFDLSGQLKEIAQALLIKSLGGTKTQQEMIDPFISGLYKMADIWDQINAVYNVCLDKEAEALGVKIPVKRVDKGPSSIVLRTIEEGPTLEPGP